MAVAIAPINTESRRTLDIRPGDTVRVWQKVIEKGKTRLQPFEGLVLARKHGTEAGGTFTVRRTSSGVGIERIFPLYSPAIDKIEVVRRAKVRRAKLYHVREKVAREVRRQMRRMKDVSASTESESEAAARAAAEEEAKEKERAAQATAAVETAETAEAKSNEAEETKVDEPAEETAGIEEKAEASDTVGDTDDEKEEK